MNKGIDCEGRGKVGELLSAAPNGRMVHSQCVAVITALTV